MTAFNYKNQPSQLTAHLRRDGVKGDASRRAVKKMLTTPKTLGKNTLAPIDYGRQVNAFCRA